MYALKSVKLWQKKRTEHVFFDKLWAKECKLVKQALIAFSAGVTHGSPLFSPPDDGHLVAC